MKMKAIYTTTAIAAVLAGTAITVAQKRSYAETKLVGIKLYDPGTRVIQVYGTPDSIEPINLGGQAIGPSGAGGGGRGPAGAGGGFGGGGGRGGGGAVGEALQRGPDYSWENDILARQGGKRGAAGGDMGLDQGGGGPVVGGGGGTTGGGPVAGGGGGGPMSGGAGMASSGKITFTRWVYKRGGSRYGFVIDNKTRVVQIEAIGLQNRAVRTRKGVGFGSTFADLIKKYQRPDAYEINGEQIVVRFLSQYRVAFRLSRLGVDKPHVVTGVVVAAGKG